MMLQQTLPLFFLLSQTATAVNVQAPSRQPNTGWSFPQPIPSAVLARSRIAKTDSRPVVDAMIEADLRRVDTLRRRGSLPAQTQAMLSKFDDYRVLAEQKNSKLQEVNGQLALQNQNLERELVNLREKPSSFDQAAAKVRLGQVQIAALEKDKRDLEELFKKKLMASELERANLKKSTEAQLAKEKFERAQVMNTVDALQKEVNSLTHKDVLNVKNQQAATKQATSLSLANRQMQIQNEKLQNTAANLNAEVNVLEAKQRALSFDTSKQDNDDLKKRVESLNSQMKSTAQKHKDTVVSKSQFKADMYMKFNQITEENEKLQAQAGAMLKEAERGSTEIDRLEDMIDSLEKKQIWYHDTKQIYVDGVEHLEKENAVLEKENENLKLQIQQFEEDEKDDNERMSVLQATNSLLMKQIEKLQVNLQIEKKKASRAQAHTTKETSYNNQQIESKLKSLEAEKSMMEMELQSEIDSLEHQLVLVRENLKLKEASLNEAKVTQISDQKSQQISDQAVLLEESNKNLESKNSKLNNEVTDLEERLRTANEKNVLLRDQLQREVGARVASSASVDEAVQTSPIAEEGSEIDGWSDINSLSPRSVSQEITQQLISASPSSNGMSETSSLGSPGQGTLI